MDSLLTALMVFAGVAILLWTAGAIYFDLVGASTSGRLAAIAWVGAWLAAFALWQPPGRPLLLLAAAFVALVAWWFRQRPSQQRNWDPHFARVARAAVDRDLVTIENVRNSEYHGLGDATARFETRCYRLSELCGIDALILAWGSPWMSHPMFVFDFGPDGRLCISVEVRYRVGQKFSLLRSLYRQQELAYVLADERDAILRRTKFLAGHDLFLYKLQADDLAMRQFFLEYLVAVNRLAGEPRWYHGLTTNCTTSVYAQGRGHIRWSWRMLLNGRLDELLYERGLFDRRLPFARLKELSRINDVANEAPTDGFGDYLRSRVPGYAQTASTAADGKGSSSRLQ